MTSKASREAASARGCRPTLRRAIPLLIPLPRLLRLAAGEEEAAVPSERFMAVTATECFLTAAAERQS